MIKYFFHAAATAAHYNSTIRRQAFGHKYSACYKGHDPFHYDAEMDGRTGEVSFASAFVSIECKNEDGVFRTVVKAGLKDYNVKNLVTADWLECGIETVYREEWFGVMGKPKSARILPIRPDIRNLRVCREPYEIKLPKSFLLSHDERESYFLGQGPAKDPVGISSAQGKSMPTSCGVIRISKDTRRITIPKHGIVEFADWMWQPADIHLAPKTAQWIQLVRLDLKNPGPSGGGGVGGNGTP
jgi:hypothetical protein